MKKPFIFSASILALTIAHGQGNNLTTKIPRLKPAIFLITTFDNNRDILGTGTGFFIDSLGTGVSCYHVFEGASSAVIKTSNGKEYAITNIISQSKEHDQLKFSISHEGHTNFRYLTMDHNVSVGEDIFVIGNPLGLDYTVSSGIVAALRDDPVLGKVIQMTAPISQGSSGSPLLNSKGNAIGIIAYYYSEGQNLNFAVSLSELKNSVVLNTKKFPEEEDAVVVPNFPIREFQRFRFEVRYSYVKSKITDRIDKNFQNAYDHLSSTAPEMKLSFLCYEGSLCNLKSHIRYDFQNQSLTSISFTSDCSDIIANSRPNACAEGSLKEFFLLKNVLTNLIGSPKVCVPCEVCSTKPIRVPNTYSVDFKNMLIRYASEFPDNNSTCLSWYQYTNNSTISLMYSIDSGWVLWIRPNE